MNITVKKNRVLTISNYKLKCSIGKSGIRKIKKEGDLATPKGIFKLGLLYYMKDRNRSLKSKINLSPKEFKTLPFLDSIRLFLSKIEFKSAKYFNSL